MLPYGDLTQSGHPIDVRDADAAADAIDGVAPGAVVEPRSVEGLAAALAWAARHRLSVVIRGGGTRMAWGRQPRRIDVLLATGRLDRVLAHRAGDLTVTVEAGVTLGALNRALAAHGQWLPLDPPGAEDATIGGLIATNDSGPHRHRFGTPRDLVLGVQLATVDGRLARAGGQVVKNVAGYDLGRLVSGSFGGLAAIAGATFKLAPLPRASATVLADALDAETVGAMAAAAAASHLEPWAVELHAPRTGLAGHRSLSCLLRFASVETAVASQAARARDALEPLTPTVRVITGHEEEERWRSHAARVLHAPGAVVRVSWLPADVEKVLHLLGQLGDVAAEMTGRLATGAGLLRLEGDPPQQAAAVDRLRAASIIGNVVVLRSAPALKALVDVWGPQPNARLLASIKSALDPLDTLGAGRGPL